MKKMISENIPLEKVIESLDEVLKTLAWVAYQGSEDSGDGDYYVSEKLGGRKQLYKDYWDNVHKQNFFSAFYVLPEDLRSNKRLIEYARKSFDVYRKELSDKKSCEAAYGEHVSPNKRLSQLRVFDGRKDRVVKTLNDIVARAEKDGLIKK